MRKTSVSRAESRSDANAVESIAHRETRRRGIQGFLTWSFFLSSVIAVDRALGIGGSRSGDDADLQQHGGPLADDLQLNSLDWSPASATNGDALTSADPAAPRSSDFLDPRHPTTDGVSELPVLERQDLDFGTLRSSFGGDGFGLGYDGRHTSATSGDGEPPLASNDASGLSVQLTVELGLNPDGLDGLGLGLGANLPLGIDLGLGVGGSGIGLDLKLGSLTDIRLGIETDLLSGGGLVPNVLGSVEPAVAALASPVSALLSGPLDSVSELASLQGLVAPGDALPLTSALSSLPGLNELFSGTQYSSYGVVLQSAALDAPQDTAIGHATDGLLQSLNPLAGVVADISHTDQGKGQDPLHDELHLKTLGGGLF